MPGTAQVKSAGAWHEIPGVGPLIASALVASIPDPHAFRSGRDLSAWIGLVPQAELDRRQGATWAHLQGGQPLSCDRCSWSVRFSVIRRAKQAGYTTPRLGSPSLLARRSTKIAAIALANKIARTAWAMMAHGTYYQEPRHSGCLKQARGIRSRSRGWKGQRDE